MFGRINMAAMRDELIKIAEWIGSTRAAAEKAGLTFRTIVNQPTRQALKERGAGLARIGTVVGPHAERNAVRTMEIMHKEHPDIMAAMKSHPMAQAGMSQENMTNLLLRSQRGNNMRDTASNLGILPKVTTGQAPLNHPVRELGTVGAAPQARGAPQSSLATGVMPLGPSRAAPQSSLATGVAPLKAPQSSMATNVAPLGAA